MKKTLLLLALLTLTGCSDSNTVNEKTNYEGTSVEEDASQTSPFIQN